MKIFVFILQTFAKIFKIVAKTFKTVAIRVNKLFTYLILLHCCRTVFYVAPAQSARYCSLESYYPLLRSNYNKFTFMKKYSLIVFPSLSFPPPVIHALYPKPGFGFSAGIPL